MVELGLLLTELQPPDLDAAQHWFERAADAGNANGMNNLGHLYATLMQPANLETARRWYERAADAGNTAAIPDLRLVRAHMARSPLRRREAEWLGF